MKTVSIKEFMPTILFLGKFIGLYLVGNLLYGWFVTSYEPRPDPVTHWVSVHTGAVISACGWPNQIEDHPLKATTGIIYKDKTVLAVYEGCNGLNIMMIFVAFLFAFGPVNKSLFWFLPLGLLIIHLMNLGRIGVLFFITQYAPKYHYFMHKYLFTASLYVVIFILWLWWVRRALWKRDTVANP